MTKITIGGKEYSIKFSYKATLKSKVLSKLAKVENGTDGGSMDDVEELLLFLPELLLVGLQKFHGDEFGYDLDTNEGKPEAIDKAFDLVDTYIEDGGDIKELFSMVEEELVNDSFLSKIMQQEEAKAKKTKANPVLEEN